MKLVVGDYVTHWENGIGKIIESKDSYIIVNFESIGDVQLPKEKTEYLRALNPDGLYANYYTNKTYVQSLVSQHSAEIIKLLLLDEGKGPQKTLERKRIKLLLTGGDKTSDWRKNFCLVDETDWKKWWDKVNKNILKNRAIDSTSKISLSLRDESSSLCDSLFHKFNSEEEPLKKRN